MGTSDPLHALLAAEVACHLGVAEPGTAARALRAVWQEGGGSVEALLAALEQDGEVRTEDRARIEHEVARRLADSGGSPGRSLARPDAHAAALHRELVDGGPALSIALSRLRSGHGPSLGKPRAGRYVDFAPAGRGGMGIVYWALDTELSRQVAFKVVRTSDADAGEDVTPPTPLALKGPEQASRDAAAFDGLRLRFLQEAWVTGGMEHPGITPVYELGETEGGVPYYTMRFVRGSRTLRSAIEDLADASVEERLDALLEPFLKVCDTVRYAHSCGVVHRDLKPENVALGEYGEVVVLDWGLASVKGSLDVEEDPWAQRVRDLRTEGHFETVASAIGSPGYMAPEAARGESAALDERSDTYALGVTLFQVLTGRLPFDFRTTKEYSEQVLSLEAPDPRSFEPAVPAMLAHLCGRALARDADERPASADEFALALRSWPAAAARAREAAVLSGQAATALADASDRRGADLLQALDTVSATCRRVLELDPQHAEARALLQRASAQRERGIEERESHARRTTLKRVGAAALVAAVLAAGVVGWLLEERRREAADLLLQAEEARARAEGVMDFMVFDLQESLGPIGRLDVLARLGATAREYYTDLPREGLSTKSLIGHTTTLRRLGEVYEARGDLPSALEAYRLAATVAGRILETAPDDTLGRYNLSLAEARTAMASFRQGRSSDAKRLILAHMADIRRLLASEPDRAEYLDALASAHAGLGDVLETEAGTAKAREATREALRIERDLEARWPTDERWPRRRLHLQLTLARLTAIEERLDQAVELADGVLRECLGQMEQHKRTSDVRWLELEAASRMMLAVVEEMRRTATEAQWEAAHAAYARLHALDPENDSWRARIARILRLRGDFHLHKHEYEKAFAYSSQAYEMAEALTKKDPTNATWLNLLITVCDRVAHQGRRTGLDTERVRAYRALASRHARRLVELDPSNTKWRHIEAYTLSLEGASLAPGDPAEAERLTRGALDIADPLLATDPASSEVAVLQARARMRLSAMLEAAGRREEGLHCLRRALALLRTCRERRPENVEVLGQLLQVHEALARRLGVGNARDLREGRALLGDAIALVEDGLTERGGGSAGPARQFASWIPRLRSLLEELGATRAQPK